MQNIHVSKSTQQLNGRQTRVVLFFVHKVINVNYEKIIIEKPIKHVYNF